MRSFARAAAAAACAVLLTAPARAWLFGRDKVESRWTAKPLPVNGDDSDWDASVAFESDGLAVSARNDAEFLYLIVTAHTRDRQDQLTGEARQDFLVWFLGPDGRRRWWGALLPFSRRPAMKAALESPDGADPAPELALAGPVFSTAAWPAEVLTRAANSARRPVWELRVPLKKVSIGPKGEVRLDVLALENRALPQRRAGALRQKGSYDAPRTSGPPTPIELNLSVRLARAPETAR
jgi:hypothetical protein